MTSEWAATTPDAALRLAAEAAGYALTFVPSAACLPSVRWDLAGVVEDTIVASDRSLSMRLVPWPDAPVGGAPLEVTARFELDATGAGLTLTLDAPEAFPFEELALPGPLRLDTTDAAAWRFLVPQGEGLLLPSRGDPLLPEQVNFSEVFMTLPVVALVSDPVAGPSLLVLAVGGHDHAVVPLEAADGVGPGVDLVQLAALGEWAYARSWRVAWNPGGGLPALAARVRTELEETGLAFPTLPGKLARDGVPQELHGSIGGTTLWWQIDPIPDALFGWLGDEGLLSVLVFGRVEPGSDTARSAAAAGYVVGPFFQTFDIFPPESIEELEWRGLYPMEGAHHGWPDQLVKQRDGWLEPGWTHLRCPEPADYYENERFLDRAGKVRIRERAVHREVMVQSYHRCPRFQPETLEKHALPLLAQGGYTGLFNDVTMAMYGIECYDPAHPCDRRTDAESRRETLGTALGGGYALFSEQARWWAMDHVHGCEGVLSFGEENMNNIVLGDYPFDPTWFDTQLNLELRVPFFGMVARHSVTRTMWWGHGQDRHAETWRAKDALCALFGGNPLYVVDPAHPLEPGTQRWDHFVASSRAFQILREHTFGEQLVGYEVRGRHLAVSTFANGVSVRANTGMDPLDGLAGGAFEVLDEHGTLVGGIE